MRGEKTSVSQIIPMENKTELQKRLENAISNNYFSMYLQFVVKTETGKICGAEALARWSNPKEGSSISASYIKAMIQTDVIDILDFYILEQVCRKLEQWHNTPNDELVISCNFSRHTLCSDNFLSRFQTITGRYHFDHHNLVIELTEDSLTSKQEIVFQNMLVCKDNGFRFALDDLGSGHTSFIDLCDYPVDIIKVDRNIVAKSITERGHSLLAGIVHLARDMGMEVLCEGVETAEENEAVINAGCDYIQGYYYSKALPHEQAVEFYKNYESYKLTPPTKDIDITVKNFGGDKIIVENNTLYSMKLN